MAFDESTKQAAIQLGETLAGESWYSSVGITDEGGARSLIVYVRGRTPSTRHVPERWHGLPVRVKRIGQIHPATQAGGEKAHT